MTDSTRTIISTNKAPGAIGPYSQAVKTDTMVFVSGQLALEPTTGNIVNNDIKSETRQAVENLKHILEAAGSSLAKVVKTTLFICPEGAANLSAAMKLRESGWIKSDERVVLLNTGSGLKYPETVTVAPPVLFPGDKLPVS